MSLLYCLVCSLQPCDHLLGEADLLALFCVMFPCGFVTFLYLVSGQMWYNVLDCIDSRSLPSPLLNLNFDCIRCATWRQTSLYYYKRGEEKRLLMDFECQALNRMHLRTFMTGRQNYSLRPLVTSKIQKKTKCRKKMSF